MDERERDERSRVVQAAMGMVGTPYHDNATIPGPNGGLDCATSIWIMFRQAGLETPETLPAYSPQWYMHRGEEMYLDLVLEHADEIQEAEAIPGDIVIYKFGRCFAHGALVIEPGFPSIVHAHKPARCVLPDNGRDGPLGFEAVKGVAKPRARRFFRHKRWSRRDG